MMNLISPLSRTQNRQGALAGQLRIRCRVARRARHVRRAVTVVFVQLRGFKRDDETEGRADGYGRWRRARARVRYSCTANDRIDYTCSRLASVFHADQCWRFAVQMETDE